MVLVIIYNIHTYVLGANNTKTLIAATATVMGTILFFGILSGVYF